MKAPGPDRRDGPAGGGEAGAAGPRRARIALDVLGAVLLGAGAWILVRTFLRWPIQRFDEGVLLAGSMLVLQGKTLYRDFYTNYPPGIFLTIATLWRVFDTSPMVLRGLGLGLHAGLALVAGRLAGRAGGRRFSWLGAGLVSAWLCFLMNVPYAWLAGLLSALVFVERLPAALPSARRGPWVAAGIALGALGSFRHDLLVYFVLASAFTVAAWALGTRSTGLPKDVLRGAIAAAGAAIVVLGLVWIPTVTRAGFATTAADLFFDQVRYVMPSRVLPMPDLLRLRSTPIGVSLPAVARHPFEGGVALTLLGPALGLAALLLVRRRERRWDAGLLLLTALSLAVFPQLLGRTDVYHALFAVPPALVLGVVLVERTVAPGAGGIRVAAGMGLALCLALPVVFHLRPLAKVRPPAASPGQSPRYGGLPEPSEYYAASRRLVLQFLAANGRPGDPVFIGTVSHRYPLGSEMELYFLADRTGATRYMQFDPGLIGRREVQEEMVRDLERSRPALAVLSRNMSGKEPSDGAKAGATVLDEYLRSRYRTVGTAGPYVLLERR